MAKALVGYLDRIDPRVVAQLMGENRRLRERVADLEAHVLRLQAENDSMAAELSSEQLLTLPDQMQPA